MATFIIAEAGVNHNGCLDTARRLIDAAAEAGANAVKFQTFSAEGLVTRRAPKADYQTQSTDAEETQFDMLKKLELIEADHFMLVEHATKCGIAFLSTPFDLCSLQLLVEKLGLSTVKVSSGDITDAPFLLQIARAAKRIILSTGMSTMAEVEAALGVLAFGFHMHSNAVPREADFERVYASDAGQRALQNRVTLLHCTSEYPAPFGEVNLRAMDTMAAAFDLPVGYSDHTTGIHVPIAAVARGAVMIEKHFTLDRTLPGPDHKASLEPGELRAMVRAIRDVECALGDGVKRPTETEWKNRAIARKSLVAARALSAGEKYALACKRPGTGMSPFNYWKMADRQASRNYDMDEILDA